MSFASDHDDVVRFGRYEVLFRIAAGGMAEVYAARMTGEGGFEKPVAVKRMLPTLAEDERFVQMFLDEGRLAAHISSPHVVQTLDLGRAEDDSLYLVMELVVGVSLSALVRAVLKSGKRFPVAEAVGILAQAADGLHDAHEARTMYGQPLEIVHRDMSPQNILVDVAGRVRITDFGVARALERATHTQSGEVKGKLGYFAPEQVRGAGVDRRTDVYALGIVAWEVLAGKRLFAGDNPAQTLEMVLAMQVPRLDTIRDDVPPALADAVAHALSRDMAGRTQTAGDFAHELRASMRSSAPSAVAELVRAHGGEALMKLEDGLRGKSGSSASRVRRATGPGTPVSGVSQPGRLSSPGAVASPSGSSPGSQVAGSRSSSGRLSSPGAGSGSSSGRVSAPAASPLPGLPQPRAMLGAARPLPPSPFGGAASGEPGASGAGATGSGSELAGLFDGVAVESPLDAPLAGGVPVDPGAFEGIDEEPTSLSGAPMVTLRGSSPSPSPGSMPAPMATGSMPAMAMPAPMATGPMATGPMATGPMATGPMPMSPMVTGPMSVPPMATGPMGQAPMGPMSMPPGAPMGYGPMPGAPNAMVSGGWAVPSGVGPLPPPAPASSGLGWKIGAVVGVVGLVGAAAVVGWMLNAPTAPAPSVPSANVAPPAASPTPVGVPAVVPAALPAEAPVAAVPTEVTSPAPASPVPAGTPAPPTPAEVASTVPVADTPSIGAARRPARASTAAAATAPRAESVRAPEERREEARSAEPAEPRDQRPAREERAAPARPHGLADMGEFDRELGQ